MIRLALAFAALLLFGTAQAAVRDSITARQEGGKLVIYHRVEPSETLYSVSRRYGATVADLRAANPNTEVLSVGDTLRVPVALRAAAPTQPAAPAGAAQTHTVATGETLYAIARRYGVGVSDLKQWNRLASNEISVGQTLRVNAANAPVPAPPPTPAARPTTPVGTARTHTVATGETLYGIARRYEVGVVDLKRWNDLRDAEISVGQTLRVAPTGGVAANPPQPEEVPGEAPSDPNRYPGQVTTRVEPVSRTERPNATPNRATVSITGYDKIVESGLAEVIEGLSADAKYIALHRTAPVGTILQIRNDMNNRSVFVKVVGNLPDTGNNAKVLVRISQKAYQRLSPVDRRFPVEVSYIP